jgi:hypothetical protein
VRTTPVRWPAFALFVAAAGCGRIGYDPLEGPRDGAAGTPPADVSTTTGADAGASEDAAGDGATTVGPDGAGAQDSAGVQDGASGTSPDAGGQDGGVDAAVPDASGVTGTISVTDPAQWVLGGVATFGSGELDVTPETRDVAGAAYLPRPYAIGANTSFAVAFSFRLTNTGGQPGDGFAFIWQNDPRGTAALGGNGGALGYGGITPSVEVEFDIQQAAYDPVANEVGIMTDGNFMTHLAYGSPTFNMADGATHYVWVDYQGSTQTLSVFLANSATQPATPLVTATVNLYTAVGSSAYIGFTGACGASTETNAIQSLSIQYTP